MPKFVFAYHGGSMPETEEETARVMAAYRHMFVYDGQAGASICIRQDGGYYRRLHKLPLEAALLHHLETTRMTLCAGYYHGNYSQPFHDIRTLERQTVSREKARQAGWPVYLYYRNGSEP